MKRARIGSILWGSLALLVSVAGCGEQVPDKAQHRQPTAAEVEKVVQGVAPLVDRSGAHVRIVSNVKGGGQAAEIDSGFQNAVVARRNSDGTVSTACVESTDQARQFLAAPVAPHDKAVR